MDTYIKTSNGSEDGTAQIEQEVLDLQKLSEDQQKLAKEFTNRPEMRRFFKNNIGYNFQKLPKKSFDQIVKLLNRANRRFKPLADIIFAEYMRRTLMKEIKEQNKK